MPVYGNHYGLQRRVGGRIHIDPLGAAMARVVALQCEGSVWHRTWGLQIARTGRIEELRACHLPAPPLAWLGDIRLSQLSPEVIQKMVQQIEKAGVMPDADDMYTMGGDGQLVTLH